MKSYSRQIELHLFLSYLRMVRQDWLSWELSSDPGNRRDMLPQCPPRAMELFSSSEQLDMCPQHMHLPVVAIAGVLCNPFEAFYCDVKS